MFFDTAVVDLEKAIVQRNGGSYYIDSQRVSALKSCIENAGRIVTAGALYQAICGDFWQGYESTLATHIRQFERKDWKKIHSKPVALDDDQRNGYRLNIKGYRLERIRTVSDAMSFLRLALWSFFWLLICF